MKQLVGGFYRISYDDMQRKVEKKKVYERNISAKLKKKVRKEIVY